MISEEEIKLRLFESICANSRNLCDSGKYMDSYCIANNVKHVYNILFNQNKE